MTTLARQRASAFKADIHAIEGRTVRAALRGDGSDLFARGRIASELGARVGERLLVTADYLTLGADVAAVGSDGSLELLLDDSISPTVRVLELRRPALGNGLAATIKGDKHG